MMSKPVITVVAFVVSAAIVLALLQFVLRVQGGVLKLAIGIIVGLIVAGIAFVVVKTPAKA